MTFLLIAVTIAWVITILGWLNEDRYRKKVLKLIKREVKSEIGCIALNNQQDAKKGEVKAYKKVVDIINQYCEDSDERI